MRVMFRKSKKNKWVEFEIQEYELGLVVDITRNFAMHAISLISISHKN